MSDGTHGHGTSLKAIEFTNVTQATNTTHWTTIANIMSIGGPEQSKDSIDISTMESSIKFREFLPGMLDAGELTMELNYDGSAGGTADDLNTLFISTQANTIYRIGFPDTSEFRAKGFITTLGHAIPFDDKITQSLTVKLNGVPTFTDVA